MCHYCHNSIPLSTGEFISLFQYKIEVQTLRYQFLFVNNLQWNLLRLNSIYKIVEPRNIEVY